MSALWCAILCLHAAVMVGYWYRVRPHGFPVTNLHFWANEALPWLASAAYLGCMVPVLLGRGALFRASTWSLPAAYLASAITARLLYPVTSTADLVALGYGLPWGFQWGIWVPLLGTGLLLTCLAGVTAQGQSRHLVLTIAAVLAGSLTGALLIWSLRADTPGTRPIAQSIPTIIPDAVSDGASAQAMPSTMRLNAQEGEITLTCAGVDITVRPLLTFHTRSPDRCLTLNQRRRSVRTLNASTTAAGSTCLQYEGVEPARLQIFEQRSDDPLRLETWTYLPEPVYSHGNEYCTVAIHGYRDLALSFSPIPDKRIELRPHDFPNYWMETGGFGYVGSDDRLHWVKGAWEEKGPFREEASGHIGPGEPLVITIFDGGRAICRVTLEDWTAQLSLALSPTAGWGLPANAIVPFVGPRGYGSKVEFQLAASHVGWGEESVGHGAGAYRNRMTVEPLAP